MEIPSTLTKENFWNELQEKHPEPVKEFCEWIDEYKIKIQWHILFHKPQTHYHWRTKFHNIPFAMQMGILFEFIAEKHPNAIGAFYIDPLDKEDVFEFIQDWFCVYYYNFKN